jgi:hypothetical protein
MGIILGYRRLRTYFFYSDRQRYTASTTQKEIASKHVFSFFLLMILFFDQHWEYVTSMGAVSRMRSMFVAGLHYLLSGLLKRHAHDLK